MAKILMTKDTDDARSAGLCNCAVRIESPLRRLSRNIPSDMTLWGNIHWSPTSIEDDLQSEVAPSTNKDRFMIGRDNNLSQWGIKRFWMRPHSTNLIAGWSDSRDYQKLRYSKVECGFLNIDARATSKKIQICETLHTYLWCCIQRHIAKTDHIKVNIGTIKCSSVLCSLLSPHENCWRSVGARLQ